MYRVITVPWDGSKTAQRALPVGAALARRLDAELELVHVVYEAVPAEPHREHLEQLRRRHDLPEGPNTVINSGMIADALAELADDPDRLLCLTSHAKALSEFMLGSTAAGVIRQATHHVLVVGPNARVDDVRFESIVVCVDGSPLSEQIMGPAVDWADGLGMKCWLLEVLDGDGVLPPTSSRPRTCIGWPSSGGTSATGSSTGRWPTVHLHGRSCASLATRPR